MGKRTRNSRFTANTRSLVATTCDEVESLSVCARFPTGCRRSLVLVPGYTSNILVFMLARLSRRSRTVVVNLESTGSPLGKDPMNGNYLGRAFDTSILMALGSFQQDHFLSGLFRGWRLWRKA